MGMGMRPFERFWFNLHRHNTRLRKDRQLHHLERLAYFWPMFIYAWVRGKRRPPHIQAPTGAFFNAQKREDHEWQ